MTYMVDVLLSVVATLCVIEGLLPCLSPERYQAFLKRMLDLPANTLRVSGATLMIIGSLILAVIHG